MLHTYRKEHTVHGYQRAYGDIDTACQHDTGYTTCHANKSGIINQHIQKCLQVGKTLVSIYDTACAVHHHKQDDRNN